MGISLATTDEHFYIPVGHNSSLTSNNVNIQPPPDLLAGLRCVFHNGKFDIKVLRKAGIEPPKDFYDTMLMAHMIDENQLSYELDMLALWHLGARKDSKLQKQMKNWDWDDIPAEIMARYAELDVDLTLQLYYIWLAEFTECFASTWETDKRFLELLSRVETKGLLIDRTLAKRFLEAAEKRQAELIEEIGFDPAKRKTLHQKLFDDPPFGYGLKVLTRTPTGQPQVNEAFLRATNHPICGLLLENSKLQKGVTAYYRPYMKFTEYDGRIHSEFKMHGTVTGRLSCADPNLQQIPREDMAKSPVKKLFMAEPGKQLWEFDYKAMELRMAAIYAREQALLDAFANEADVHQITADGIKITRQQAKTLNFSMIYGGGVRTLMAQLALAQSPASKLLKSYRELYPRIYRTALNATAAAEETGYVKTWTGRRRHYSRKGECYTAFNSIIQGGCAEVLKHSAIRVDDAGFDVRNLVHDSLWVMLDSERYVPEVEQLMQDWTKEAFGLQLTVESKRLN